MTFVAPSSALPPGMCGSNRPKIDTMRPLTESSRPSITIVSSSGRKARMLGTMNSPASGEPWNGVHTATRPFTPSGGPSPASGLFGASCSWGAGARAAASAGSPPVAASIAAAAAAPDATSRCLPMSPPLLCATSTRPAALGARFSSARPRRSEVSAMPRRFVPRPCTTRTRCPAALRALPRGRRKVQCSYTPGSSTISARSSEPLLQRRGEGRARPIVHGAARIASCRRPA